MTVNVLTDCESKINSSCTSSLRADQLSKVSECKTVTDDFRYHIYKIVEIKLQLNRQCAHELISENCILNYWGLV